MNLNPAVSLRIRPGRLVVCTNSVLISKEGTEDSVVTLIRNHLNEAFQMKVTAYILNETLELLSHHYLQNPTLS